jgi:hypothetical protein
MKRENGCSASKGQVVLVMGGVRIPLCPLFFIVVSNTTIHNTTTLAH